MRRELFIQGKAYQKRGRSVGKRAGRVYGIQEKSKIQIISIYLVRKTCYT